MEITSNWLVMALLTPTFWALGCLLDSFMIGSRVYRRPSDGAIVSCLFCAFPVLFVVFTAWPSLQSVPTVGELPITAVGASLAYVAHLYYYFRTLFCLNDVSGAETFVSLNVLIVPLLAWLLLAEVLPAHFYLAFLVAAGGVLLQCLPVIRRIGGRLLLNMLLCVVAVSLSMVLQASALQTHGFRAAVLTFNASCFSLALLLIASRRRTRQRMARLLKRFPLLLSLGELLAVLALLSSHRATQIGPSVSVIALFECLLPLFIMVFSLIFVTLNRLLPRSQGLIEETLLMQLRGSPSKMAAMTLLMMSFSTLLYPLDG